MSGFSLRIFLPDGSPDGLRLVEKSNWTGRGIVCPRPLFPTARAIHSTLKVLQEELSGGKCLFVMVKDKRWDWIEEKLAGSAAK